MECGVTLSKHTFADDLTVSVGVPAMPLTAVASPTDAIHATVNGGILSLIKDSNEQLVTNQLRRRNRSRFSGIFLAAHSIRQTRVERQSIKSMAQREPDRF